MELSESEMSELLGLPSPEVLAESALLRAEVLSDDVDETTLTPEVLKMRHRYRANGAKNFHISLAPGFVGTREEIAETINATDNLLSDPVENLLSRLGGRLFGLDDSIMCLEKKSTFCTDTSKFVSVPLNAEERQRLRRLQSDRDFLRECQDIIRELKAKSHEG